jgi:hypothetical protein
MQIDGITPPRSSGATCDPEETKKSVFFAVVASAPGPAIWCPPRWRRCAGSQLSAKLLSRCLRGVTTFWIHPERGPDGQPPQHGLFDLFMVVDEVSRRKMDFQVSLDPPIHLVLKLGAGNCGARQRRLVLGSCGRAPCSDSYGESEFCAGE